MSNKAEARAAHQQSMTTTTKANPALQKIKGLFGMEYVQKQIAAALPKHISPERMIRIALTAIQHTPKLLECEPWSIVKAVVEASELGLEPSDLLGHAFIVPYRNKRMKKDEAQLQIGYRGFIELARRSGRVKSIIAEVVYTCDEFVFEQGIDPKLIHRPNLKRPNNAKPLCVYAVAHFTDGGVVSRVMTLAEIAEHRAVSARKTDGPWETHWPEMARKTVIRVLAKYLPLSPEVARAAVIDEYRDTGHGNVIDIDFVNDELVDPETGEVEREPGQEG